MIASLTGLVRLVGAESVVIEVGGVGLSVTCTPRTLAQLRMGQTATLSTSLVVREDSLTLFGFLDDDERAVFEVLQTATGVGPRLAQAVLATYEPDAIRLAVSSGDVKALTLVSGIGTKGAQRMVVELRDRLSPALGSAPGVPGSTLEDRGPIVAQVREALIGLGTKPIDADDALRAAAAEGAATDAGQLLKLALRMLDRR